MRTLEQQTAEASTLLGEELVRRGEKMLSLGRALLGQAAALEGVWRRPEEDLPPEPEPVVEELEDPARIKSVELSRGQFGVVTYQIAKMRAEELGVFTQRAYAERLGLRSTETMRWLSTLMEKKVLTFDAGRFECCAPPSMRDWVTRQTDLFSVADAAKATRLTEAEAQGQLEGLLARKVISRVNGSGLFQYEPPPSYLSPNDHPHKLPPERDPPNYADAPVRGMPVRKSASDRSSRAQRSVEGAGGIKGIKQRERRYKEMQDAKERKAAARSAKAKSQPGSGRRRKQPA